MRHFQLLPIVFGIATVFVAFFVWETYQISYTPRYFEHTLQEANVSGDVYIDTVHYSFDNGIITSAAFTKEKLQEAQSLLYAQAIASRHPILGLEGTNVPNLRRGIEDLKEANRILASLQDEPHVAQALENTLSPIAFLTAVTNLEEKRQEFLSTTTPRTYRAYSEALSDIFPKARADLYAFRTSIESLVPGNRTYVFGAGSITKSGIIDILNNLQISFEQLEAKASTQAECISGRITICDKRDIAPLKLLQPLPEPETLDEQSQVLINEVRSILADVRNINIFNTEKRIPLAESFCLPNNPGPVNFIWWERTIDQYPSQIIHIDDIYFTRAQLPGVPTTTTSYFEAKDIPYRFLSTTAFYTCPLIAIDTNRVYTAHTLMNKDIFEDKDALSSLTLMHTQNSGLLGMIVRQIGTFNTNLDIWLQAGAPAQVDPEFLLVVRSGFYTLFLAHHSSLNIENPFKPFDIIFDFENPDTPFAYSQARDEIKREDFIRYMKELANLHTADDTY